MTYRAGFAGAARPGNTTRSVVKIDPNATLDELIELVYELAEPRDAEHAQELLAEIVHKATDLREWISRGGFTPTPTRKV
jgi:hypothetical protein